MICWNRDENYPIKEIIDQIKKNPDWHFYTFISGMKTYNYGVVAPDQTTAISMFSACFELPSSEISRFVFLES